MSPKTSPPLSVIPAPGAIPGAAAGQSPPRRAPSQRRALERVERILTVAAALIEAEGSDALRMSDVAERAEISIGSLYQYFPDKTALIGSLAERFNAYGYSCVERDLAEVRDLHGLREALGRSVDGYYVMFLELPAMREIWAGAQAAKTLREIDIADIHGHADLLGRVLLRFQPDLDRAHLATVTLVLMQSLAATVRLAIALDRAAGHAVIVAFKRILMREIEAEFFGGGSSGEEPRWTSPNGS